MNDLNLTS